MTPPPNPQPVFLHGLFRTGSTYLFKVFRRLGPEYTCFQEPLHEIAIQARTDKSILWADHGDNKVAELRHPALDDYYFRELYEVAEQCLPKLSESAVYNGYFAAPGQSLGIGYWRSLIEHSAGRTVIQECRSAGRIAAIREQLGGYHTYLWRNPRTQWWSYQVSPYFDMTTQLIFNAPGRPPLVDKMARHIGFQGLPGQPLDVAFDWFSRHPLKPDEAYKAFYTLWLLGQFEADQHADLLISIEQLSGNAAARRHVTEQFAAVGVTGLDFSDCHCPETTFTSAELQHFRALEDSAHRLWVEAGMPADALDTIVARVDKNPTEQSPEPSVGKAAKDLARYRNLVLRRQEDIANLHQTSDRQLQASHRREDKLRAELEDVYNSRSWRITGPMRKGLTFYRKTRSAMSSAEMPNMRGAFRHIMCRCVSYADRVTHRSPRFRQQLLRLVNRYPRLLAIAKRNRNQAQFGRIEKLPVTLTPRSREIYRQLTAAVNNIKSQADCRSRDENSR